MNSSALFSNLLKSMSSRFLHLPQSCAERYHISQKMTLGAAYIRRIGWGLKPNLEGHHRYSKCAYNSGWNGVRYTVGTESIQTPLNFSFFVSLQYLLKSKKFILFLINVFSAPHLDRKKLKCRNFCKFIKKEKLKYHMVISIQTLCCDTHI